MKTSSMRGPNAGFNIKTKLSQSGKQKPQGGITVKKKQEHIVFFYHIITEK